MSLLIPLNYQSFLQIYIYICILLKKCSNACQFTFLRIYYYFIFYSCCADDETYEGADCIAQAFEECFVQNGIKNDLAAPGRRKDVTIVGKKGDKKFLSGISSGLGGISAESEREVIENGDGENGSE